MRRTLPLLLALVSWAALAAENPMIWGDSGDWGQFDREFEDSAKWQELQQQLPPYPKPENFIPIPLGARSGNQFFVDYASVSAGKDGVVRYSIVARSPSGAETVSFEGMRCTTGERKLYAFGHDDRGVWSRNRYAKWEPIQGRSLNDFRRELFHHYFCTVEGAVKLSDIQRNLKSGGFYRE